MRYALPLLALACAATAGPVAADVTKSHRREMPATAAFAVENLSGTMTVRAGSGSGVVVNITVHGEDQALVDSVSLVQDTDAHGRARLLVRYPVDRHSSYRAPGRSDGDGDASSWSWLASLFGGSGSSLEYDGHRVRVGGSGVLLWADVQVEVPAQANGLFKNHVGAIRSSGTRGTLRFDSGSGDITLDDVSGTVVADTGSGDVKARGGSGTFTCDTGSGDCDVLGFQGERVDCDTGSGDVNVDASGVQEVTADTGSGSVNLAISGTALRKVSADTGSGDVHLRLDPNASFQVNADIGSGDIVNRYADATPIVRGREVKGYRRGDGRAVIDVDTGSGDVVLESR